LDQHCASPSGIRNKSLPWEAFQKYRWDDVKTIITECQYVKSAHGDGSWDYNFSALMSDGSRVAIGSGSVDKDSPHADDVQLVSALRNHDIAFDSTAVAAGCHPPNLQLLTSQP